MLHQYQRSHGLALHYEIAYAQGEYFISRDGNIKKSVADAIVAGVAPQEAAPELMLRMAIADIEALIGMEE